MKTLTRGRKCHRSTHSLLSSTSIKCRHSEILMLLLLLWCDTANVWSWLYCDNNALHYRMPCVWPYTVSQHLLACQHRSFIWISSLQSGRRQLTAPNAGMDSCLNFNDATKDQDLGWSKSVINPPAPTLDFLLGKGAHLEEEPGRDQNVMSQLSPMIEKAYKYCPRVTP